MSKPKLNFWYISIYIVFCCFYVKSTQLPCKIYTEETKSEVLLETRNKSHLTKDRYFIDVFTSMLPYLTFIDKRNNFHIFRTFGMQVNSFFNKVMEFNFYCLNHTETSFNKMRLSANKDINNNTQNLNSSDHADIISIRDGTYYLNETISDVTPEFMIKFVEKFNMANQLDIRSDRSN